MKICIILLEILDHEYLMLHGQLLLGDGDAVYAETNCAQLLLFLLILIMMKYFAFGVVVVHIFGTEKYQNIYYFTNISLSSMN